jgi:alginate O-acetyltransferase complex protein AlgI
VWARPVFAAADISSSAFGFADAWLGVLAYTFQIYFDFSGYSDMAIGLGTLFGWRIPVNFNSPYKARSVIDFWRRWHMTLTSFLTENIFFRLPGSRKGVLRRHLNLMITMVICGFWHGAGWTFLAWGALHGAYLIANHTWRKARELGSWGQWRIPFAGQALTIVCVAAGWALFGAKTIEGGARLIQRMFGFGGPVTAQLFEPSVAARAALWVVFLGVLALTGKNTQEILAHYKSSINLALVRTRSWSLSWLIPGLATLWVIGFMLYLINQSVGSPFMYAIF